MREILFRGKRCDNGELVQGYYIRAEHHWHKHGIHKDWIVCSASANGGWFALHNKYAVKAETVGQFTGLTDKNGKKIFEGDIVETHSGLLGEVVYGSFFDDEYECDTCGWFWIGKDEDKDTYKLSLSDFWGGHKVVGNIHDNHELLGDK